MRRLFLIFVLILINSLIFITHAHAECIGGDCAGQEYRTRTLDNGEIYRGFWKNDLMHGQGTMTWPNGDEYAGAWKDGVQDGHGAMTWANGDIYVGEWKNDLMNGQGTYIWANGDEYMGAWKDGMQDGQGTYTGHDEYYSGIFINGQMPL